MRFISLLGLSISPAGLGFTWRNPQIHWNMQSWKVWLILVTTDFTAEQDGNNNNNDIDIGDDDDFQAS